MTQAWDEWLRILCGNENHYPTQIKVLTSVGRLRPAPPEHHGECD